ncbi:MAG: dihydrofolate reductase family protein [Planctomycetota bacterium]|nr:dihydrofolate reductase family protein [Planctomycetota bacterium]
MTANAPLILYIACSLDGFISGPGHDLSFLEPHADALEGFAPFLASLGGAVMGRTTFDQTREYPWSYGALPVRVLSSRPMETPSHWPASADVRSVNAPLASVVSELRAKASPGQERPLWLIGGASLVRQALEADLLDRVRLFVLPSLLGGGTRLWPEGAPPRRFTLTTTRRFASGACELEYSRVS